MGDQLTYLIGVDGGGSGTRLVLADLHGNLLARAQSGPSGLALGIDAAWSAIKQAVQVAFAQANIAQPDWTKIAMGCGLAGVNNPQWAKQFIAGDPGLYRLALETDARTTVLGAHGGQAGAIIALGTGSVGEVMLPDGSRREVGGWGFPSSDEASGAWLGLRAINHAQKVLDGRRGSDALAQEVITFCGGDAPAVANWLAQANQTSYAQLAPIVIQHGVQGVANEWMQSAGQEIEQMALALDSSEQLPIALCGGLAAAVWDFVPQAVRARLVKPQADAVSGALRLIQSDIQKSR